MAENSYAPNKSSGPSPLAGAHNIDYRPDIDGLRAVAVTIVILYHAGVEAISGGFTGVDVFFVISGYLITSIITAEMRQERFSLIGFYERRVRRIFPALMLVSFTSCILAVLILMPLHLRDFGQSLVYCVFFVSNMLFWSQTADYFGQAAHTKPLLHTWSLAIEEQFYLLFPLLLMAVFRWFKGRWREPLITAAAATFFFNIYVVEEYPEAAFYLAPARAWELLIGALIALGAFPPIKDPRIGQIVGFAGLALVGWGAVGLTSASPMPGFNALYPCGGAAMLIHSGKSGQTFAAKLLSLRPMVFTGLISYPLYLWHWPLLVFAGHMTPYRLSIEARAGAIILAFAFSVISWKYIERPFRGSGSRFARKEVFSMAALAAVMMVSFGASSIYFDGWPGRITDRAQQLAYFIHSKDPRINECNSYPSHNINPKDGCVYGADVAPTLAVWGDSHASAVIGQIGKMASDRNRSVKYIARYGCPPISGIQTFEINQGLCPSYLEETMSYLESSPSIETVVLVARYSRYIKGNNFDFGPTEQPANIINLSFVDVDGAILELDEKIRQFERRLRLTVDRLLAAGKIVAIVYPIPETGYNIPLTLAQIQKEGGDIKSFTRPHAYYKKRQKEVIDVLDRLGDSERILRLRPESVLCPGDDCIVSANGNPLYYDDDHLSLEGAEYISSIFLPLFDRWQGSP